MAEMIEGSSDLESTTVAIGRTSAVVKGGRRFSFSALVVVGNRRGRVGIGYGKAPGVPVAIEKAQKDARKNMFHILLEQGTIPHPVTGRYGASTVKLIPAAPGTGVIAGGTIRAILEMAGVRDALTKAYGSTNEKNLLKAASAGLRSMRAKDEIAALRGVELPASVTDEMLALGAKYAPKKVEDTQRTKGPVNKVGQKSGGRHGGGGRGRRSDRGGDRGGDRGAPPAQAAAPAAAQPAEQPPETPAKPTA